LVPVLRPLSPVGGAPLGSPARWPGWGRVSNGRGGSFEVGKREGFALRTHQGSSAPLDPSAKGEALSNLSIGWVWEDGLPGLIKVPVSPPPTPTQINGSKGHCPWLGPGAVALVSSRASARHRSQCTVPSHNPTNPCKGIPRLSHNPPLNRGAAVQPAPSGRDWRRPGSA
jgi:hypothetical protein